MRLFFALWPDDTVRDALAALALEVAAHCGGRPTARANLHATLAFLGAVPRTRLDEFISMGAQVRAPSFDLQLETVSHWRHNHIVWAGARRTPPALADLASDLTHALVQMSWPIDERPYTPHVTLVRDAHRAPLTREVALPLWRVNEFALVSSSSHEGGVCYTPLARWPLSRP